MATNKQPQAKKRQIAQIKRGDIYLVSFDPTIGHEIKKTRPAVVIQNDIGNKYSPVTIVAAITSTISAVVHPVAVAISSSKTNGLDVASTIRLDQIRSIDKQRLVKRIGTLEKTDMQMVDKAIGISLGLVEV